ncbi:cingulin [Phoenix dactylifera]|uniref:Cingulin n=1 Tax=Phoenix dactylifera TaxID=42345 RepID=A0A8B7BQ72_PHODC|nr:cingulin [Phoenix dactylifera]
MAGLLAWAADVVGGSGQGGEEEEEEERLPVVFTPEQQQYALELDQKAASLRRSIQDLRLRIPPAHISQRLPHLHAHTLASNAALALQLNSHSATREQAQLRAATLQEENAAYEKAISNCQKKIQEKLHEADLLQSKLREMDLIEKDLKAELERALAAKEIDQPEALTADSNSTENLHLEKGSSDSVKLEELEEKKRELNLMEERVQRLENEWSLVQQESIKQPSPAQREKLLEKQLHSLIEQLTAKQAQAEGLVGEIRDREKKLERLDGLRRKLGSGSFDVNATRNRFARGFARSGTSADYTIEAHRRPFHTTGRVESQQKFMLLRSAFVLYILALHVIVFIKISF